MERIQMPFPYLKKKKSNVELVVFFNPRIVFILDIDFSTLMISKICDYKMVIF